MHERWPVLGPQNDHRASYSQALSLPMLPRPMSDTFGDLSFERPWSIGSDRRRALTRSLIVTTSWDDGHSLDVRLADILNKYNIRGTFYIARNYLKMRLTDREIVELSKRHEIGAHTMTHPALPKIPLCQAKKEIHESKRWLENLLDSEVPMFCYPYGYYDESIVEVVRKSGFRGARTVKRFCIARPSNPYEMAVTLQARPLTPTAERSRLGFRLPPSLVRLYPSLDPPIPPPLVRDYLDIRKELRVSPYYLRDWTSLARSIFDFSLRSGGVFHLWGHSWEIDKLDMWRDLESILEYISGRRNCIYTTNAEILAEPRKNPKHGTGIQT